MANQLVIYDWLVVWNIWIIFPYIGNVIIPSDELIFFRGVGIPVYAKLYFNLPRLLPEAYMRFLLIGEMI